MEHLLGNLQQLFTILLATHAIALAIVNLTDTPKDDEAVAKIYRLIEVLAGVVTRFAKR